MVYFRKVNIGVEYIPTIADFGKKHLNGLEKSKKLA